MFNVFLVSATQSEMSCIQERMLQTYGTRIRIGCSEHCMNIKKKPRAHWKQEEMTERFTHIVDSFSNKLVSTISKSLPVFCSHSTSKETK